MVTPSSARDGNRSIAIGLAAAGAVGIGVAFVLGVLAFDGLDDQAIAVALTVPLGIAAAFVAVRRFDLFILGLIVARPTLDAFGIVGDTGVTGGGLDPAAGVGALSVASGLIWLVAQFASGSGRRPSNATFALGLVAVGAVASVLVSNEPIASAEATMRVLSAVVMFAVIEQLLSQRSGFALRLVGAVFVSLVAPAAVAVNQIVSGSGGDFLAPDRVSRVVGTFAHPNPFGTYLVTLLLLSVAVAVGITGAWRVVASIVAGVAGVSLVFTYARGAWVAAVVGLLVLGALQSRRIILGVVVGLLVAAVLAPSTLGRIGDLTEERDTGDSPSNSFAWRVWYWGELIPLAAPSPLNGIGLEMAQRTHAEQNQPHNVFVQAYVETGIFGLGALVATIVAFARDLAARRRRAVTQWDRALAVAAIAVVMAFAVQLPSENLLTQVIGLWFLAAASTHGAQPGIGAGDADRRDNLAGTSA